MFYRRHRLIIKWKQEGEIGGVSLWAMESAWYALDLFASMGLGRIARRVSVAPRVGVW